MINSSLPKDWKDLEKQVARILNESGLYVDVGKDIKTVRGTVNIDVYAEDDFQKPKITYLCECKYWKKKIPKTVIHAFRTVVNDYGANWGLIISSEGFQSGSIEASANSNIMLLIFKDFEQLFFERWFDNYMGEKLYEENEALVDYTEPFNARIMHSADKFDETSIQKFRELREKYVDLAFYALSIYSSVRGFIKKSIPPLPKNLKKNKNSSYNMSNIPNNFFDAKSYRDLLEMLIVEIRKALFEFDNLFGGRA